MLAPAGKTHYLKNFSVGGGKRKGENQNDLGFGDSKYGISIVSVR